MQISKRRAYFIANTVVFLLFLLLYLFLRDSINYLFIYLFILFPSLMLIYVKKEAFNFKELGFLELFIIPLSYIFSVFHILYFFSNINLLLKGSFIFGSAIFYYYILLALNIFIVSDIKKIIMPLQRPAEIVTLLGIILSGFFFFTTANKLILPSPIEEFTLPFLVVLCSFFSYYVSKTYFWTQTLDNEKITFIGKESLMVSFLIGSMSFALFFFNIESFFKSLILTNILYVSLSYIENLLSNRLYQRTVIQYILTFIFIILFIFLYN